MIATPKAAATSLGTFQALKESDSEQESGDSLEYKEFSDPQQLEPTSTAGVPLELSLLILTQEPSKQIEEEDLFKPTDTSLIIVDPPSPPREPTPPPPPPLITATMADKPKGVKFDIKKFTGKKEEADEFCTNLNLYFQINPSKFTNNATRVAFALGNIMGGARQWKINKVEDLNNATKADIQWDNWEGFKTSFKWNWSEVDSPGSAMNSIYAPMEKAKKNKISMENYISLFKEYIQKAGIVTDETQPNNAAVSLFCQGLPYKVLDKAMNQNPTNLAGWYTSVQ